jgi:predicted ATPase/DNA-binding SARP family transcriptional activator
MAGKSTPASQRESVVTGLRVRLLGPVEVTRDGHAVRLPGAKPAALLALLAIHVGEVVGTDRLADGLWGGRPPRSAGAVLRTYGAQLRHVLGAGAIETTAGGYALRLDRACVDARVFEQQLAQARAGHPGRPEVTSAQLRRALALWRGVAFGELAWEAFAVAEAQRLEELRWVAVEDRVDADLAAGGHALVAGELRQLVSEQPLRDRLRWLLIVALYRSGRHAEALDAFQDYRRLLADELGVEPSPELTQLQHAVLTHDPSLGPPPAPATAPAMSRPHNLPAAISSFVGRAPERSEIAALVTRHRLVTLVGAGGCGKTRLAIEVGSRRLGQYADGVWVAELAPLTRPEHVAPTVGAVWGLQDVGTGRMATRVVEYLTDRDLLLIADNCEHVLPATADLVNQALRAAPLVRVLATSREPLGVDGEVIWRVPSLGLPPEGADLLPDEAIAADAVGLFVERAAQARPGFALTGGNTAAVVEICRRLDGIPLAIELAAARARALTPSEIADRLDQRFTLLTGGPRAALPRHRTLRALTDWSWDLLSPPERRLCRSLSVFAGGFTLAAAAALPDPGPLHDEDVLALVTALVEKSLLVAEPRGETTRFGMLETIRQYALERLTAAGEEHTTRDRHLAWVAVLYEQAETGLAGPDQRAWARTCELELDNARAALAWAQRTGQHEHGLRITAVNHLWPFLGHLTEGRSWLERFLASPAPCDPRIRARALNVVGFLAYLQQDLSAARAYLEQSLAQHTDLREPAGVLRSLGSLAAVALAEGNRAEARRYLTAAPEWARLTDDTAADRARITAMLSRAAIIDGEIQQAAALARESLAEYKKTRNRHGMAGPLERLSEIAYRSGDLQASREHIKEALDHVRGLCKVCTENMISNLAHVLSIQGDDPAAVNRLIAERDRLRVELGLPGHDPWTI